MKTIITLLLAFAMLISPVELPYQQANGQMAGAILIVSVAVVAGCIIVYACKRGQIPDSGWHYLVLDKTHDCVHWTPVVTNYLPWKLDQAWPAFTVHKTDPVAFYRLREITGPDSLVPFRPEIVAGRSEQPIIY